MATKKEEGRKMKKMVVGLLAVAIMGMSSTSYAFTMFLNDLNTAALDVVIVDNGVGDTNPLAGVITFNNSLGDWLVNVTTGITKPVLGTSDSPHMDLNSVNVSSSGPADLRIGILESDFSTSPIALTLAAGGTTNGIVFFDTYVDSTNSEIPTFATNYLGDLGPFTAGAFSGTTNFSYGGVNPYTLFVVADISHTVGGVTSFDAEFKGSAVPEPGTMLLLGSGILGLGLIRRRKQARG